MMGYEHYLLLTGTTVLVLLISASIWQRTQSAAFALGTFLIYYWTLFGAWTLVTDLAQNKTDTHYEYLFGKMFRVELDGDYFEALFHYSLFVVVLLIVVYLVVPRRAALTDSHHVERTITISHFRLAFSSIAAVSLSFYLVQDQLAEAVLRGMSGYSVASEQGGGDIKYLLHQTLNQVAVIPAAVGVAVLASGGRGRYVTGRVTRLVGVAYLAAVMILFGFGMLMGNKNELFGGMILGVTFFLINSPRPRILVLSLWGSLALAFIAVIDFTRSLSIVDLASDFSWSKAGASVVAIISSNEAFAAHFSMYGVLHHHVSLTWGTSVQSLVASLVPRMFWSERPETVYAHYVDGVGALAGQGYTIHHATGWFLNFGVVGVVFGAALLGLLWGGLFRGAMPRRQRVGAWRRVYFSVSFAALTGSLPVILRNGLEVYKPIVLYALVVPVLVIWASSWRVGTSNQAGDHLEA